MSSIHPDNSGRPFFTQSPFQGVHIIKEQIKTEVEKTTQETSKFFRLGGAFEKKILPHIKGLVHREKKGNEYKFDYEKLGNSPIKPLLAEIQDYCNEPKRAISTIQRRAMFTLCYKDIDKIEEARMKGQTANLQKYQEKQRLLEHLLELSQKPKLTRHEFKHDEWKAMDRVDFFLFRRYMESLCELFNSDEFNQLQFEEAMKEFYGVGWKESFLAEGLARKLAYVGGLHGKTLKLPVKVKEGDKATYILAEYKIQEFLVGDSLPCYILESNHKDARPWFIARGTQVYTGKDANGVEYRKGSYESILMDTVDPKGVGRHAVKKAFTHRRIVNNQQQEALYDILQRWRSQGKRVCMAGHSLGGYIVNDITVRALEMEVIKRAYGFTGPGVSEGLAKHWYKKVEELACKNNQPMDKLFKRIVNFSMEGDLIPSGGHQLIGKNIAIRPVIALKTKNPAYHHTRHCLSHSFFAQEVDLAKENKKLARRLCEIFRRVIGLCLRLLLLIFNRKDRPDWWVNKKVYTEKLRKHDLAFHALLSTA